ncbi:MAG TPA: hypothetical protein VFY93_17460 [Planctomycetota bacterium]|nr:hypothetical protein [Planctomycetota bacterium]
MRKYLLPAAVCAAIGALILLLVKGGDAPKVRTPEAKKQVPVAEKKKSPLGDPAETPTRIDEHAALRELERTLAEGNTGSALYFRQKVCEDMDNVLANGKLTKDLLDTIRKYGIESDDLAMRDVVLPILRIVAHPEATRMIAEEYYRAKNEGEQMTLLEAMSKPFHDPAQASVWAVDKALNSPSAENRERAFDIMKTYVVDNDILVGTAMQIFDSTSDPRQRSIAIRTVSERGRECSLARESARRVLRNPQDDDIAAILPSIANWGTEDDAARLDALALEHPAQAEGLREHARLVRRARRDEAHIGGHEDEIAERAREDEERQKRAEEEARALEQGGG